MKVILETNEYAVCLRCGEGARDGDPLFKFGQFVEWVTLHKTCFDIVAKGVEELFASWKRSKT